MTYPVIILSKTASNLKPCIESIRKCQPDAVIITVDDGVDWSQIPARAKERGDIVLPGIQPFVFSRNVNTAIEHWRDIEPNWTGILLHNDDAILQTQGGFFKLAEFAEAHPEVGCVAPATNVTGQPLQWPKNRTPEGYRFVDTVPYVCVYIPRRTFDRVGLLDTRYQIDYGVEDRDHTYAMTQAGLEIAVLYDVYVDHGSLVSSFRGDPKTPKSFAQNYALFKAKWGIR